MNRASRAIRCLGGVRWLVALLLLGAAAQSRAQDDPLTLRVNDVQAEPGGLVAITVRTYASRPVSQGQLTIRPRARRRDAATMVRGEFGSSSPDADGSVLGERGAGSGIFDAVHSWTVFSSNGDATSNAGFISGTGDLEIDFESLSATINDSDGPMLVIHAWLDAAATPGDEFELEVELGALPLEDEFGASIPVELRAGTLRVVSAADPLQVEVEGEESTPGSVAHLAISTEQVEPWISGFFEVTYPTAIVSGLPTVQVDPRFGTADLILLHPEPGVVSIDFQSADASLNFLPGAVIQILLPLSPTAPAGFHPLSIDAATAQARGEDGSLIPLTIEPGGGFEVLSAPIFSDGFESGGLGAWTVVP